jgi:hypothetical protein
MKWNRSNADTNIVSEGFFYGDWLNFEKNLQTLEVESTFSLTFKIACCVHVLGDNAFPSVETQVKMSRHCRFLVSRGNKLGGPLGEITETEIPNHRCCTIPHHFSWP